MSWQDAVVISVTIVGVLYTIIQIYMIAKAPKLEILMHDLAAVKQSMSSMQEDIKEIFRFLRDGKK